MQHISVISYVRPLPLLIHFFFIPSLPIVLRDIIYSLPFGGYYGYSYVGIVLFSTVARVVLNPTGDQNFAIDVLNSVQQQGGEICMGCGVQTGVFQ